jgi:CO/xanthine dehydrogenase Mo-binding subunit
MPQTQTKCWRNVAYAKVTGKAKFTDDLKFANVLHSAPAYSDFNRARIGSIDTSTTEKLSGGPQPASVSPTMAGIETLTARS